MTDNEIIKVLPKILYGGHGCIKCEYAVRKGDDRCGLKGCKIARDAFDLINRQKAEIEELKEENNIYTQVNHLIASQRDQRDKEIEELTNNIDNGVIACDSCHKKYAQEINNAKSEAIREFWNRRPPQLNPDIEGKEQYNKGWNACISEFAKDYKAFVKEMAGETGEMQNTEAD